MGDDADKLPAGQLQPVVKALGPELDSLEISLVSKNEMRAAHKKLVKKMLDHAKAEKKAREKSAPADAAKHAAEAKEASRAFTVVRMDVGANDKLGRKMLDAMKKEYAEGSFMIISADPDKKAVGSYAVASEAAMAKGVDA